VARERSLTASPGRGGAAAAAAAAEIAGMLAAGGGGPASAARPAISTSSGAGGVSSAGYPELAEGRGQGGGGGGSAAPAESKAQQPPVAAASAPTAPPAGSPGLYPAAQQPAAPVSKRAACEAALSALRAAAAARGGAAAGAAAYHAWGLAQLAADPEGRDLLWEVRRLRGGTAVLSACCFFGPPFETLPQGCRSLHRRRTQPPHAPGRCLGRKLPRVTLTQMHYAVARRHVQGNAIPLAIFLLGQPPAPQQQAGGAGGEAEGLDACKPALCATLQRMAARDAGALVCVCVGGGGGGLKGGRSLAERGIRPQPGCPCDHSACVSACAVQRCHIRLQPTPPLIAPAAQMWPPASRSAAASPPSSPS
jgi:hypothetical protein